VLSLLQQTRVQPGLDNHPLLRKWKEDKRIVSDVIIDPGDHPADLFFRDGVRIAAEAASWRPNRWESEHWLYRGAILRATAMPEFYLNLPNPTQQYWWQHFVFMITGVGLALCSNYLGNNGIDDQFSGLLLLPNYAGQGEPRLPLPPPPAGRWFWPLVLAAGAAAAAAAPAAAATNPRSPPAPPQCWRSRTSSRRTTGRAGSGGSR